MSKIPYNIISTGSKGNAVVINRVALVDCGVSYKSLEPYVNALRIVLLTHEHTDHFRVSTIKTLAERRPSLRFGCGKWLVKKLLDAGVHPRNIDVFYFANCSYNYGLFIVKPVPLVHNVPNCGYKLEFADGRKAFYATDTNTLDGIEAPDYDLYLVEANYEDDEIKHRISEKKVNQEYIYELDVLKNHLSKQKCDDWIYKNIGATGEYVYLHGHESRDSKEIQEE